MDFIFVIPVIVIIIVSAFIVKISAVALNLTGLNEKKAFFQALSAFTGTGFTTRDSESVVGHDIRRRIIMGLMVLGNAGLVSVITTLMLSFFNRGITPILLNTGIILLAVLLIIKISQNKEITRKLTKKIQEKLIKSSTFTKRPVEEILRLAEGYGIAEVTLNEFCIDRGKTLFESSFRKRDILILAIERGSSVLPAPHASDELLLNDTLICYGKLENIATIGNRAGKD
ncbi:MAG: potassium transporter TrkA [Candidatus Omnitrophota bacterium]|nr:potassium transporter TrkA [Candidatus Omnitrophota bacterium]MBU1894321.1 potassium transporter TrkA [Candidatus Omnitrophota bacterium]